MRFSIIIPVYKAEKYLHECVNSILNQTFTDFELLLVDDGSPDSCPSICDEYAVLDSRVHVIHQRNSGASAARNSGLLMAAGDYVSFIDSDDYLIDNLVLERISKLTLSSPDIIHYKFVEWFESDGHISPCQFDYKVSSESLSLSEKYCELIDKDAYYNSAWSKVIKRDLLMDNNISFEEGIVGEDNEWYYHVVLCAQTLVLLDEPLYVYRRRENSVTSTVSEKNLKDQLYILAKWESILSKRGDDTKSLVIKGSLAKQYCSAIIIYSQLNGATNYFQELQRMLYLLSYSSNRRVVVFRCSTRIIGLKGTILALRLYRRLFHK